MEGTLWGSNFNAAAPTSSGSDEESEHTIGIPKFMASTKGRPNPSYRVGQAYTKAER